MANVNILTAGVAGWTTVLNFDWTAQASNTYDFSIIEHVIGGKTWQLRDIGKTDTDSSIVTNGTGLILANDTSNAATRIENDKETPSVGFYLKDAFPDYNPAKHELRIWWHVESNQANDFEGPQVSINQHEVSLNETGSSYLKYYDSGTIRWYPISELDFGAVGQGGSDTRDSNHDVFMIHVVTSGVQRWYTGLWSNGWPALSAMTVRRVMQLVHNTGAGSASGTLWSALATIVSVCGSVTNNTLGTHQITVKHTRMDYKEVG